MTTLEKAIGYQFENRSLLNEALTHSSHYGSKVNNERLEFLGDAVLELTVSEYLFNLNTLSEGEMTKMRASIVCSESLSRIAEKIGLGEALKMGKGEISTGGRHRKSILENAFEALTGAVFKDSNFDTAKVIVMDLLRENIELALKGALYRDYKTALQEKIQKDGEHHIEYRLEKAEGPEHAKCFYIQLVIDGQKHTTGTGKTKKEAEQQAARQYLLQSAES